MAIVIEDGTAKADSEAYLSVADFKSMATKMGFVYSSYTDAQIEQALRRGAQYLDNKFRYRFLGIRTDGREQAMEWPRQYVTLTPLRPDVGDWLPVNQTIPSDEVPIEIINASYEATTRELVTPGSLTPDYTSSEQVVSETVGPLSVTYASRSGSQAVLPVVTAIDRIVAPILRRQNNLSGTVVRG